ncbi:MAG: RNA polymerase-binding protein RbpA [Propionibacteriaceae bacterium]|jgi:ribosomal protein L37AE/L43A|nr:RNA polymerase-binding protein RbpA [Propionibacteriaceae bacterium]
MEAVELAPRQQISYTCSAGHTTVKTFAVGIEPPLEWDCQHCSESAYSEQRKLVTPLNTKLNKSDRTSWEMLRERRTIAELETLLAERLAELHYEDRVAA